MNVLIFVMSMLMIFVLMTYARLDTYRTMAGVEGEFTRYMEQIERTYINMSAEHVYDKITFKKKEASDTPAPPKKNSPPSKEGEETPEKPKGASSGRLSIAPLVDAKARETNSKEYTETVLLFKKLIQTLYGRQKQFQEMLQKRPALIDELIEKLPRAAEALKQKGKFNSAVELSNLELGDGLDEAFYMMLKGCPSVVKLQHIDKVSESAEEKADDAQEADEFTSDKSYDSLLNFIDLHASLKINIYLASRQFLLAIYGDPAVVENILQMRQQLYKAYIADEISDVDASAQLKNTFQLGGEDSLLDYKVTGSNPQRYN